MSQNKQNLPKIAKQKSSYSSLIILLLVVCLMWALSGVILYPIKERGTFGDMFGAINGLFSGLGLAALIYTIFLQRKQLDLQQSEIVANRKELEENHKTMIEQNKALKEQNFEGTFFHLVTVLNEIIYSIDFIGEHNQKISGRDCFASFYLDLSDIYKKSKQNNSNINDENHELNLIENSYLKFYETKQMELGHYFRILYNIVKYVDKSEIENKKFYTNILRAQMSNQELLLLFYNSLTSLGRDKFKPLIEEFCLLKNMPQELLLNITHVDLYARSAFKRSTALENKNNSSSLHE